MTLRKDVAVGGFTLNTGFLTGNGVTISATSTRTITFQPGATVAPHAGGACPLVFGANTSLSGNFTVNGNAAANPVVIAGNTYSGTVTIQQGSRGNTTHTNDTLTVDGGGLFVRGDSSAGAAANNLLTVAGGATFGGVGSLGAKNVTLSASNSRRAPGMHDIATDSQLVGTLPLGTHTLTLFTAVSAPVNYSTFESQWDLDATTLPAGWQLADPGDEFQIVGNDIVMNIVVPVPEPATILMALPLPAYLAWRLRTRRRRATRHCMPRDETGAGE